MDTQKRVIVWVSALLVLGITGVAAWQIATGTGATHTTPGTLSESITASDWTKGANASTTKAILVEYSDFQCPACGALFPIIEKVTSAHASDLTFAYRNFPLSQHPNAIPAASAAVAAGNQGKFFDMYKKIFETQADWSESTTATAIFEGYARDLGLNMTKFKADRDSQATKDAIKHDQETGLASGVNSTPTFYLNGKKMTGYNSIEEFQAMIEKALTK